MGRTVRRSSIGTWVEKQYCIGNVCLFNANSSCRYTWAASKWLEGSKTHFRKCACIWHELVDLTFFGLHKFARAVTKWTGACDRRLVLLISYIHHTDDHRPNCHVGNTAQHCRLGLFQDSNFAGDVEDSKSTSAGILCIFGSRTFVPISWMCKKPTSVSHSSTKSEVISLDAGLRMDGLTALDLWDVVIEVLHSQTHQPNKQRETTCEKSSKFKIQNKILKKR